jgi:hypothetical protein
VSREGGGGGKVDMLGEGWGGKAEGRRKGKTFFIKYNENRSKQMRPY